ncbi:MAG: hypothetical protein IJW58_04735 [Clostridia bacterium]|nr:hypothetical protein [Clostridia bacterium]MBQ7370264.1 hypothetical protein [Clostridia bacterium]
MKKFTAYEIALSALSCAFCVLFLTLGAYVEILRFTGYLFASASLLLPLAKKSYKGYVLAYIGSSVLGFIFVGGRFFELLPFVMFFGLHPLVNELQLRTKLNTWVACFLKALWFDGTMYVIWRFLFGMESTFPIVDRYILPIILILGTGFFVFYDYTLYKARGAVNEIACRFMK